MTECFLFPDDQIVIGLSIYKQSFILVTFLKGQLSKLSLLSPEACTSWMKYDTYLLHVHILNCDRSNVFTASLRLMMIKMTQF